MQRGEVQLRGPLLRPKSYGGKRALPDTRRMTPSLPLHSGDFRAVTSPPAIPSSRSLPVALTAWLVIVAGAALSVISAISLLMLLARSYGTNTGGPLDWLLVLAGPPVTFIAGIGLLRRRRWAWLCVIGILLALLAWQVWQMANPPSAEPTSYVSPSGVKTTVMGSGPVYSLPLTGVCAGMLALLLSPRARREFARSRKKCQATPVAPSAPQAVSGRDWRVGHTGRDMMYYEELRDGTWQRLSIDGEMLMGRAHHVIYFASPERWQSYPEWARHRRDEIMARIQSEFREPDYEYTGGGITGAMATAPTPASHAAANRMTSSQFRALVLTLAILLGISALMAWLVHGGLQKNETWWPAKRASQQRIVSRAQEPAMFWTSIGVYSAIGLGTFGLAVCMVCWSRGGKKS
jgi:hypothetical protein